MNLNAIGFAHIRNMASAMGRMPPQVVNAIEKETGININLHDFDEISRVTPNICHLSPAGPYVIADLEKAGGMKAVMKRLESRLNLDRINVNGVKFREIIDQVEINYKKGDINYEDMH